MNHLRPTLITSLSADLAFSEIRKTETIRLIHLLVRLEQPQSARDAFLGARKESMLRLVRFIKAEGDISLYISELAVVCFTVVRNTADWYMTSFKENGMASGEYRERRGGTTKISGFIIWARQQIEDFAQMFRRQVYAPNVANQVAEECIRVTASHNRKVSSLPFEVLCG
jgi:hypothetical protein